MHGQQNIEICTYDVKHLSDRYCYLLLAWMVPSHPDWQQVDCVSNVMAHAQKTDLVFRRNG